MKSRPESIAAMLEAVAVIVEAATVHAEKELGKPLGRGVEQDVRRIAAWFSRHARYDRALYRHIFPEEDSDG